MKTILLAVAVAAGVSACAAAPLYPILHTTAAVGIGLYCSDAFSERRQGVRDKVYGDPSATILTREDCE